jgi:glycosyltransferase involved in cell wall biosynthesis
MDTPRYSFVIPVCNEAEVLVALRGRLANLLDRLDGTSEVLLVDDGSTDDSYQLMLRINAEDDRFKAVHLSRNFGHQIAITAGMDLARGDAVVIMDADLQDPPEVVLEMVERWRDGYEVVYGIRTDRTSDSVFKRLSAQLFYRTLRRLTSVDIPLDVGDFRLVDRRALEAFLAMREGGRFVRGMYAWIGFKQIGVPYRREERYAGSTKYPLRKMLALAADGVLGFSHVPLRLALKTGFGFAALSLLAGFAAVLIKITGLFTVPGWTSIVFVVCLIGGVQLGVMGLIGEYLGRTYEESIGRPLYIVSDLIGMPVPANVRRSVILQGSAEVHELMHSTAAHPGNSDLPQRVPAA